MVELKRLTKEVYDNEKKIVDRAIEMGIANENNRITHNMDIEWAYKYFNINFDKWLDADDENFAHDFIGIYNNIERSEVTRLYGKTETEVNLFNFFVPRFSEE